MEKIEMILFAFLFSALGYCVYLIQEKNKEVEALNDKVTAASLRRKQKQRTRSIRKRLGSMEDLTSTTTSSHYSPSTNPSLSNAEFTSKPSEIPKPTDLKKSVPAVTNSVHNNSGPTNNHTRRSKTKI